MFSNVMAIPIFTKQFNPSAPLTVTVRVTTIRYTASDSDPGLPRHSHSTPGNSLARWFSESVSRIIWSEEEMVGLSTRGAPE
jgi:hypothetical protein